MAGSRHSPRLQWRASIGERLPCCHVENCCGRAPPHRWPCHSLALAHLRRPTIIPPATFIRSAGFRPGTGADVFVRFYGKLLQELPGARRSSPKTRSARSAISPPNMSRSPSPTGTRSISHRAVRCWPRRRSLFKKIAYDPINDFEHVTTLSKLPFILLVAGEQPVSERRRSHEISEGAGRQGVVRLGREHRSRRQRTVQGAIRTSRPSR